MGARRPALTRSTGSKGTCPRQVNAPRLQVGCAQRTAPAPTRLPARPHARTHAVNSPCGAAPGLQVPRPHAAWARRSQHHPQARRCRARPGRPHGGYVCAMGSCACVCGGVGVGRTVARQQGPPRHAAPLCAHTVPATCSCAQVLLPPSCQLTPPECKAMLDALNSAVEAAEPTPGPLLCCRGGEGPREGSMPALVRLGPAHMRRLALGARRQGRTRQRAPAKL